MEIIEQISKARRLLKQGKILAYPTEAVYGLGCDPFNQAAVANLISLKQREFKKGFIVLIENWEQLNDLIAPISSKIRQQVQATWPGPVTWLFPKSKQIPPWVTGNHQTIAIRMSNHPIAKQLCEEQPILSTSANVSGLAPAKTLAEVQAQFPIGIDAFVAGALGGAAKPTAIFNALTGEQIR